MLLFKRRKQTVVLLLISLILSLTGTTSIQAEEEKSESKYYGPRDGIEVEELRTETAKQYLLPDGTMQYIGSPDRIHWKDEDGKYKEIDNTIIEADYYVDDSHYLYTNKSNDIKMFFADSNVDNAFPIRIEYQEYAISFGIQGSQIDYIPRDGAIVPATLSDNINLENFVMYQADQGFQLLYAIKNSGEKEYIILKDAASPTSFSFTFSLDRLISEQTEHGVVFLNEEGQPVFEMGGFFAVDGNDNYTDNITATLVDQSDRYVTIDLSIDQEWIQDPTRVFPVIIDPTEMVCGEYVTRDTYISSQYPTENYYVDDYLYTGNYGSYGECRSFIAFDNPNINYSSIISATVNLRLAGSSGAWNHVPAYEITSNWQSSDVKWNYQPNVNYSQTVASAPVADTWHDTSNWYCWDVFSLIGNWLANYNYGIVLKSTVVSSGNYAKFYSSDYGYPNRPELMINYISGTTNSYVHSARLVGTPMADTSHNHYSYMSVVSNYLQGNGYYVASGYNTYNVGQINSILADGSYSVCVIKAHGESISGGKSRFIINEPSGLWYSSQNILNQSSGALSDYQLIVFICCYSASGQDNGLNLASAAKAKGAKATVGFTSSVSCQYSTYWVEDLFDCLTDGLTLLSAVNQVKYYGSYPSHYQNSSYGLTSVKPMGDTGMTLE